MESFEASRDRARAGVGVSLKVRVSSGCFHREHSPHAFALIDQRFASTASEDQSAQVVEHESGPEVLVVVGSGLSLAASIINLIVSILHARQEGIRRGDQPSDPLELIVRRFDESETLREETILRIAHTDRVDPEEIERKLNAAVERVNEAGRRTDHQ